MAVKYASASPDPLAMLDDMSVAELTTWIKAAEERRLAKLTEAKRDLMQEMSERAEQLGLSLGDLLPHGRGADEEQALGKGVRNPAIETHRLPSGVTKKGRGKASHAYLEELAKLKSEGRSEHDFLIKKGH